MRPPFEPFLDEKQDCGVSLFFLAGSREWEKARGDASQRKVNHARNWKTPAKSPVDLPNTFRAAPSTTELAFVHSKNSPNLSCDDRKPVQAIARRYQKGRGGIGETEELPRRDTPATMHAFPSSVIPFATSHLLIKGDCLLILPQILKEYFSDLFVISDFIDFS
jgi:hypothetical protein